MVDRRTLLRTGGAVAVAVGAAAWLGLRGMGSMAEYDSAVATARMPLSANPEMRDLIRYASLAPSGHNAQPWQFLVEGNHIDILPDLARRTAVVDPDDHHLFISLGAAAETLSIAAAARGRGGETRFDPANGGSIRVTLSHRPARDTALCDAIPRRQSTRGAYDGSPVDLGELTMLQQAAAMPGVDLVLMTDCRRIDAVRDLVLAGNAAQMDDPAFVAELREWLRFSPHTALATGDGLFSALSGNPALPDWLGPTVFDWTFTTKTENDKYAARIASLAGLAVFAAARDDPEHWVLVGRACQRFALQATALGLKHAFQNQPVEVAGLRPALAALAGLPGRRPDLVMRFGRGPDAPYSARRAVDAVQGT